MRLAWLAFGLLVLLPASGFAQDYKQSVLYMEPADTTQGAAPVPAAPDQSFAADSTTRPPLHAPRLVIAEKQPPLLQPILLGTIAAAAGAFGGAALGYQTDKQNGYYDDVLPPGTVAGYFIGETLALPLGVHLGNGSHGSFLGDLGLSVLGHLGAIGLIGVGNGVGYLVGIAGQITATVVNERSTAKHRLRDEAERGRQP
jgi:hypothetical protein